MRSIKLLLAVLGYFCFLVDIKAQLNTNEIPISFVLEQKGVLSTSLSVQTIIMPALDMAKIEAEDREDELYDIPPRFGYSHRVNCNLSNSGTWQELPNGDKLWRLNVVCPGALSVNFCYDQFWIPEGGKLFLYSKDRKHYIGAFTSMNNKGDKDNIRGFATGLVYGDDVVLEYYQPKEVTSDAVISIEYIVHGYRYIGINQRSLGESGTCMVNVNCEEGQYWQNEKNAVAMVIVSGERYCTGALLVTTDYSQKPYFLTANHCLGGWANGYISHDAALSPNLDNYSFYWNYEAPGCNNISVEPSYYSTSGATILANNPYSDFALLQLTEDPKNLLGFTPYYLGWDITGGAGNPGVCIHHPNGDVKKISSVYSQPISTKGSSYTYNPDGTYWKVIWKQTLNGHGTTAGGSSGSPLLTAEHRVIGQLQGGYSSCDSTNDPDWYGKFDVSWDGNNSNSEQRRLSSWLDSLNTGLQTIEGLLVVNTAIAMANDEQLYANIKIMDGGLLTIQGTFEFMGNSQLVIESGGVAIVDGGTLSNVDIILKPGALLRIINGGIIETRNGFLAPVGASVEVINGQIT